MHPEQFHLREAITDLTANLQVTLPGWVERVRSNWPATDRGPESAWAAYLVAVAACRIASAGTDPNTALASVENLAHTCRQVATTRYSGRAADVWMAAMEVEEANDDAVTLLLGEELAAAARRLVGREPTYRPVLNPLTRSPWDEVEVSRKEVEIACRATETAVAYLRLTAVALVRRVESPFMTLVQAARYCGLEQGTLSNALYRGQLTKSKRSRKVLIHRDDLDHFMVTGPPKKGRPRREK